MPSPETPRPPRKPPNDPKPDTSSKLRELVAECLDRFPDEGSTAIEAVCTSNPDLAEQIRARLATLAQIGLLAQAGDDDARFPERLGEYRLIRKLGGGGMGVVFLAEQPSLARRVALKVVRPGQLFFGQARERFRREAQLIATLRHPGIVPVFAFGEEGDLPYYAMEYIDGASLEAVLEQLKGRAPAELTGADFDAALARATGTHADDPAPAARSPFAALGWVPTCVALIQKAAEALAHAHAGGVVHRDVKPSNVMLTRDGRVLLVDFGLSTSSKATKITRSGSELGSLPYMPPELLRGGMAAVDARSDVYSLGVTLYELLTLRPPFEHGDNELTRRAILAGAPRRPRELNPALPWDAETVCLTAMDVDPAQRYATAEALAHDLGNVLALRPISVKPAGAWRKSSRWAQRNPARAVAAALAVVVLVGGPLGYAGVQHAAAAREHDLNVDLAHAKTQVDETNQQLLASNTELEKKRAALTASLANESTQRTRAEKSFERAKRAVTELLENVGAEDLRGVPQMEPVRRRLLEKALAFHREMLVEAPDDPGLAFDRARTGRAVADLLFELGRFDEAHAAYEHEVPRLRALVDTNPGDTDMRDGLASCLSQMGWIEDLQGKGAAAEARWDESLKLLETVERDLAAKGNHSFNLPVVLENAAQSAYARGDAKKALERFDRAVDVARKVRALKPDETRTAWLLGEALDGRATALAHLGRGDEAVRASVEAYALFEKALATAPNDRRLRVESAKQASNYGVRLLTGPDPDEAERVLRSAYDQGSSLARDFPADPELQKSLAIVALNYGSHLSNRGKNEEGVVVLDRAIAILDALSDGKAGGADYSNYLAAALANASGVRLLLGDVDGAEPLAKRALALLRAAQARARDDTFVRASLAVALFEWGKVRCARGDLEEAAQAIDEGLALRVARPDILCTAVEALGDCAKAADAANDETLMQRFVESALTTLRESVKCGFRDAARLRSQPELSLVREDARFEAIVGTIPTQRQ